VPGTCLETTYWELAAGRPLPDGDAEPKPPAEHRLVGKPGPRLDLPDIVTGRTRYVQDLSRPGMLHGRVVRPPGPGGALEALELPDLPGATVVRDGSFLGVLAEREEQAVKAAEALYERARWRETAPLPDTLSDWLPAQPAQSFRIVDGAPVDGPVEPPVVPAAAVQTVTATYTRPYQMHASIGPSAALAEWTDGRLTVWTHSQGVYVLRAALAEALGLEGEAIRVVHVVGPGCYGHNGADDAALDAALLARAAPGRPVLLKWTRADEHGCEPYGPPAVVRMQASLDESGALLDWNHDVWGTTHLQRPQADGPPRLLAGWQLAHPLARRPPVPARGPHVGIHRNADPLYAVPARRVVKHFVAAMPLRTSAMRSLGAYANVFAIESFMDELALAAGADPLEFRLRYLVDERGRAVLETAAARAGWAGRSQEFGRGRGIGFARYKNTAAYAAVVADVRVDDDTATIVVERAVIAADAGQVVDPEGLANQLEGGVIQAASWTLKEEVRFDERRVTSLDWDTYPILRFPEVPEVETVLLDRPDEPPLGAGEATQGPTAGAIANAVYDAVGVRLRDIPFTPERLRARASA
jgi:nicotinate dehydrogenase subunit B